MLVLLQLTRNNTARGRKMGKKQKRGGKQSVVLHREAFMRMNFLLQASMAVLAADPSRPQLCRFYVRTMRSVGKRLVLKMDPHVKRLVCRSCDSLLVPGVTATHRVRAHREQHLVVRCLTCGSLRRYLTRPEHQLWCDNPSNVAESSEPRTSTTTSGPTATTDHSRPTTVDMVPNQTTTVPLTTTMDHSTPTTVDTVPNQTATVPLTTTVDHSTPTTVETMPNQTATVPLTTTMDHSRPTTVETVPDQTTTVPQATAMDQIDSHSL